METISKFKFPHVKLFRVCFSLLFDMHALHCIIIPKMNAEWCTVCSLHAIQYAMYKVYFSFHVIRLIYIHLTKCTKRDPVAQTPPRQNEWMLYSQLDLYILHCIVFIVCIFKQPFRQAMHGISCISESWAKKKNSSSGSAKQWSICNNKWGGDEKRKMYVCVGRKVDKESRVHIVSCELCTIMHSASAKKEQI